MKGFMGGKIAVAGKATRALCASKREAGVRMSSRLTEFLGILGTRGFGCRIEV